MLGTSENCSTRPPKWSRRNETLIFKKWKIELYIFKYMFYYLYIYNNPSCVSRGLFLGSCNRLPDSELSTSGDCSTMLSAKRRFFTPLNGGSKPMRKSLRLIHSKPLFQANRTSVFVFSSFYRVRNTDEMNRLKPSRSNLEPKP